MYGVYDPAKPPVFMSQNVRFGSPLVGEGKEEPNEHSDSDNNYLSDSDTATNQGTEEEEEEEEEEKEEEEEAGNENITDLECEVDSDEEELEDLLQQAREAIPESLLGDDSQFAIDKVEEIIFSMSPTIQKATRTLLSPHNDQDVSPDPLHAMETTRNTSRKPNPRTMPRLPLANTRRNGPRAWTRNTPPSSNTMSETLSSSL